MMMMVMMMVVPMDGDDGDGDGDAGGDDDGDDGDGDGNDGGDDDGDGDDGDAAEPCLVGCFLLPDRRPEGERANCSLPHTHHDDKVMVPIIMIIRS